MNVKTVWILNHYAVLPSETGSTRHYEIANRLVKKNWATVIFAASFSHWERIQRIRGLSCFLDRTENQIKFRFIRTPSYNRNGILRIMNMLVFFITILIPRATKNLSKPDVIIGSSVHPLAAWAAQILAARYKVPFVFEVRDLWPQTLIALQRIDKHSIAAKMMYWLEKKLCQQADKIIALLPNLNLYISQFDVGIEKIEWIPNGVNVCEVPDVRIKNEKFTIMYVGAHGEANALETVIDCINILKNDDSEINICFRFIGEGDRKHELIQISNNYSLTNISFENGVPKSDVPGLMAAADAFIISAKDLPELYKYGVSMNKIYDYMLAGRPVIIAMEASNNPVEEAGAGICVRPESPPELAAAIKNLMKLPKDDLHQYGVNGRKYVEKFHSYDQLAEKFERLLNDLI